MNDFFFFFSPLFLKNTFISVARSGWLEGSVSVRSLQFHFLQTLEHRTDVSVTSTSPWREAPALSPCSPRCPRLGGCWAPRGAAPLPLLLSQPVPLPVGSETSGSAARSRAELCPGGGGPLLARLELRGDGSMCWPFSNPACPNLSLLFPKTRKCVQPSSAAFIVETDLK